MTLNKIEFLGIALSIMAMAGGLWFMRLEATPEAVSTAYVERNATPVVVTDGDNQSAALANAIIEAADTTGTLKRLIVNDIIKGNGEPVVAGDTVAVHYIGRLQNGQEFDNSYKRGTPFTFTVGEARVIPGWDEGLKGMKVGGQRVLIIPSDLGYGEAGFGPIPGGATLVFAIELLEIN